MMKKVKFIIFIFFTFSLNAAFCGYEKKEAGFYLNHYDRMKDLKDQSCKTFLGSVYRGGLPLFDGTDNWIKKINASKVKMVFDLRDETKNAALERDTLLKNGIAYVKLPLKTSGSAQDANMTVEVAIPSSDLKSSPIITKTTMSNVEATLYVLDLMDKNINEQSTNTIYLHCQRGEDRTGLMVGLLRDCKESSWKSEFINYGGVMYKSLDKLKIDVDKVRKPASLYSY